MLSYPHIDPVALALGPVKVHWYGIMYLIGFVGAWILGKYRAQFAHSPISPEAVEDLIYYSAFGVILGGRVGYILFYHFDFLLQQPLILFKIWQGGMSFHGGMLGVFIAMYLFGKKHHCSMLQLTDIIAPLCPIGLGAGRIGNFINSELWGRITDVPWGMVFPNGGDLPRHPSQLYEAILEGGLLFAILWLYTQKPRPTMAPTGLILMLYGAIRFFIEFFRMPDAHLGYLWLNWVTMGQILSLPMIIVGAILFYRAYRSEWLK